ncbi:hypothetical protein WOLCODRAFT_19987 [Wolfiporia cocos MD-104 SS10]|uniref:Uncharacterized protein n=1 Tax=Wolfiporia cocos (strain MD-104) TaxID=742152 RepID=A0A2H3JCR6_WOLCO|nr:hypothetical protein WOLCODRAFT_19987 [Wolfiporia cocos MD-104 SS10]
MLESEEGVKGVKPGLSRMLARLYHSLQTPALNHPWQAANVGRSPRSSTSLGSHLSFVPYIAESRFPLGCGRDTSPVTDVVRIISGMVSVAYQRSSIADATVQLYNILHSAGIRTKSSNFIETQLEGKIFGSHSFIPLLSEAFWRNTPSTFSPGSVATLPMPRFKVINSQPHRPENVLQHSLFNSGGPLGLFDAVFTPTVHAYSSYILVIFRSCVRKRPPRHRSSTSAHLWGGKRSKLNIMAGGSPLLNEPQQIVQILHEFAAPLPHLIIVIIFAFENVQKIGLQIVLTFNVHSSPPVDKCIILVLMSRLTQSRLGRLIHATPIVITKGGDNHEDPDIKSKTLRKPFRF